MKLFSDRLKNVNEIKNLLGSDDIIYFDFISNDKTATVIYAESLSDKTLLGKQAVEPLKRVDFSKGVNQIIKSVTLPETEIIKDFDTALEKILLANGLSSTHLSDYAALVEENRNKLPINEFR